MIQVLELILMLERTKEEKSVKPNKKVMSEAVSEGILDQQLNTFDSIRLVYDFDPAKFKTFFYQNIAAANYFSHVNVERAPLTPKDVENVKGYLKDDAADKEC